MTGPIVYRVQDRNGRGPYKPGMSHRWSDGEERGRLSIQDEFGWGFLQHQSPGEAIGCGFRSVEQLLSWFSDEELRKLYAMGYRVVAMRVDRILEESDRQCVFVRHLPLCKKVQTWKIFSP